MKSLSVIILSYMEVKNLLNTFNNVGCALVSANIKDFEIILVTTDRPDGTNDGTPNLADCIASKFPHVHRSHGTYKNRADAFIAGLQMAQKDFVVWIPGDNIIIRESLVDIFSHLNKAELIIGYTANESARPFMRRILSRLLVKICNFLFGLKLKYYSGITIFPCETLKTIPLSSDSIGFMVEATVFFLKTKASFLEVPQYIRSATNNSSIGNLKSILSCIKTILHLKWRVETSG